MRIIDAHHHLWDLKAVNYPWLMQRGVRRFFGDPTPIQRDYTPAHFKADFGALRVLKSVHIQVGAAAGQELEETRWLQKQHECTGFPTAIVAFCDLTAPDVGDLLDAHSDASALRGVRQIVGRSSEEDARTGTASLLANPDFERGLRILASKKLSFDLQLVPEQLNAAASLFERVPELPVALCHAGSLSDQSADGIALWQRGINRIAALPNTICKISGLGMFDPSWTAESAKRQFNAVLDAFGPDRVAFGSNFPVDGLYSDYASVWARFAKLAADLSAAEQAALHADTAERFYRL